MRCFAAVYLTEEVQQAIWSAYSEILRAEKALKAVQSELLHITLYFFGEIGPAERARAERALAKAAGRMEPFEMRFGAAGAFPSRKRPNVIWLGLEAGEEQVAQLNQVAHRELEAEGFPKDNKRFSSHVTLARVRRGRPCGTSLMDQVGAVQADLPPQRVTAVQLMESELSPDGPAYKILSEFKLGSDA